MYWRSVQLPRPQTALLVELAVVRDAILLQMAQWSGQGLRVLELFEMGAREGMTKDDEADMTFLGFLASKIPSRTAF